MEPDKQKSAQSGGGPAVLPDEKPGWFENLGLRYFHALAKREHEQGARYTMAATDEEMVRSVRWVTIRGIIIAFLIGGISAGGSVFTEEYFPENSCDVFWSKPCIIKYGWVAGVTAVLTLIEFAVLFWVAMRTVYFISRITGHSRLEEQADAPGALIPNLLSRAALEIPDPVMTVFGIDPLRNVSKRKMVLIGLLYKAKIMLSNVVAKLFLRRVVGKSVFRVSAAYIAVPITGLWNALVIRKVAREARLRLFGNLLARRLTQEYITEEKLAVLSPRARLGCLQAVGNSIVLTQNYHPNMMILLVRLSEVFHYDGGEHLDQWDTFLETLQAVREEEKFFILDLLAVAAAFDGRISRMEREHLGEAFQEHTEVYFARIRRLKDLLLAGRFYQALEECKLDFEAG